MSPTPEDQQPRTFSRHDAPNLTAPASIEHLLQLEGLVKGHEAESQTRLAVLEDRFKKLAEVVRAHQPVYVFHLTLPFIGQVRLFTITPRP